MYIEITSDVNKNATFWGLLLRSQELIIAEILYSSQTLTVELWYPNEEFGLEIPVENTLISVFWIDWESDRFLCFRSGTNLVTDRILRWLWSHSLTSAFGNGTIICQLANSIIRVSTYEKVNFINVNLK